MKWLIPWVMVVVRALLGPGIMVVAHMGCHDLWLSGIVLFCLVDDIFDGILARQWKTDTQGLRLADSLADTVFYLGVAGALWLRAPWILRSNFAWLVALFVFEGVRYIFDFAKYRKAASYHSYLAKAWGLVIAAAMVCAFLGAEWLVRFALVMGLVVNAEGLTMSLILPRWQNDVKTLASARRLRERMLIETAR